LFFFARWASSSWSIIQALTAEMPIGWLGSEDWLRRLQISRCWLGHRRRRRRLFFSILLLISVFRFVSVLQCSRNKRTECWKLRFKGFRWMESSRFIQKNAYILTSSNTSQGKICRTLKEDDCVLFKYWCKYVLCRQWVHEQQLIH
jgi:hypothetical protein